MLRKVCYLFLLFIGMEVIPINALAFTLASPAFANSDTIPVVYSCEGNDISPALNWQNPPPATKSFVLVVSDPDAPSGVWYHWILFNIPSRLQALAENEKDFPREVLTGENSWKRTIYNGPCPPPNQEHRYFFTLYALDNMLDLPAHVSYAKLESAMKGHILTKAELMGRYKRQHI